MAEQNMIERAAKAAEAKAFEGYTIDPIDLDWITIIRAAIEAMRDPTGAILDAGSEYCGHDEPSTIQAHFCWKAMIDACLEE